MIMDDYLGLAVILTLVGGIAWMITGTPLWLLAVPGIIVFGLVKTWLYERHIAKLMEQHEKNYVPPTPDPEPSIGMTENEVDYLTCWNNVYGLMPHTKTVTTTEEGVEVSRYYKWVNSTHKSGRLTFKNGILVKIENFSY